MDNIQTKINTLTLAECQRYLNQPNQLIVKIAAEMARPWEISAWLIAGIIAIPVTGIVGKRFGARLLTDNTGRPFTTYDKILLRSVGAMFGVISGGIVLALFSCANAFTHDVCCAGVQKERQSIIRRLSERVSPLNSSSGDA